MKLKKAMLALVCALALVVGSVMGTMAYLQDTTDVVTNTFTVGKVKITLDEIDVDIDGVPVEKATRVKENDYKLMPGHTYTKDPTVHVEAGSENAYIFVKVVDEITAIEDVKTVATQITDNGWIKLAGVDNVYYQNHTKQDAVKDYKVFDNFKVLGTIDNDTLATYAGKTIKVTAYAIQADGMTDAADAWAKGGFGTPVVEG